MLAVFSILEYRITMIMKAQDIVVALKLVAGGWPGSFAELGLQLGMSSSSAHAAFKRAQAAGIILPDSQRPNKTALAEFLVHGLKYVFPAQEGSRTRGLPTSYGAPPLAEHFSGEAPSDNADIPVWPDPQGSIRGSSLKPLCRSVPSAARRDKQLYEWLALADALRSGRARERELAAAIVRQRLGIKSDER